VSRMVVEMADAAFTAERIKRALRNAPPEFRRAVDRNRMAMGEMPVFESAPSITASTNAKKLRRLADASCGWVVGSLTPGLSVPVFSPQDGLRVREVFTRAAWESMLADVAEGRNVTFKNGHDGHEYASTKAGTLRLERHALVGGMFEARLEDDAFSRLLFHSIPASGADVSVGFVKARSKLVTFRGETVRVIRSAELDHIAVIAKREGIRGAYRAAHCFAVEGKHPGRLADAWRDARCYAHKTAQDDVPLSTMSVFE
jgi:hypothetical protein